MDCIVISLSTSGLEYDVCNSVFGGGMSGLPGLLHIYHNRGNSPLLRDVLDGLLKVVN